MLHKGEVMLPLCELCFDVFANRLDFGKTVSFLQVTSEEHLTSYGRPLCTKCSLCSIPANLCPKFSLE